MSGDSESSSSAYGYGKSCALWDSDLLEDLEHSAVHTLFLLPKLSSVADVVVVLSFCTWTELLAYQDMCLLNQSVNV